MRTSTQSKIVHYKNLPQVAKENDCRDKSYKTSPKQVANREDTTKSDEVVTYNDLWLRPLRSK